MGSLNRATLCGNIGSEPKITNIESTGGKCAQFSLATSEPAYTLQNGTQVPEKTEWHNIVAWGALATLVEKYLQKGLQVYVEGKICTRKYTKNNVEHYSTEIVANNIVLLRNNWKDSKAGQAAPAPAPAPASKAGGSNKDDDLPF